MAKGPLDLSSEMMRAAQNQNAQEQAVISAEEQQEAQVNTLDLSSEMMRAAQNQDAQEQAEEQALNDLVNADGGFGRVPETRIISAEDQQDVQSNTLDLSSEMMRAAQQAEIISGQLGSEDNMLGKDQSNSMEDKTMAENDSNQPKNLDEWLAQHPDLDPNYVASVRLRVDTIGFDLDDVNKNFADYQARQAGTQGQEAQAQQGQEAQAQQGQEAQAQQGQEAQAQQQEKTFSDEEYASAVELANGDLSKLSFEQTSAAWSVLSSVDEVIAQKTHPDRTAAKNKLKEFAEQRVAEASQKSADGTDQPLSMENAPELSSWLAISNDVQANNNSKEKKDRNAALGERLDKFYKEFDEENGLNNLPDGETIEKNSTELEAMEKDFEPFARDGQGNLVHPEFAGVAAFYDNLEIDNSDKDTDELDKKSYRDDMAALAIAEANAALSIDPEFAKLSAEDKKKRFITEVASHMEMGATNLIATQMAMNAAEKAADGKPRDPKEFEQNAHKYFEAASNEGALPLKVQNKTAMAVLASRTTQLSHTAKRVAQKTGAMNVWNKVKKLDQQLTKNHPKAYPFLKNMAKTAAIGGLTGGAGLAVYSAYKAGKAIQKSVKNYKENRQEGQSYWNYLKKNPKQIVAMTAAVAGAALSAYGVGGDFLSADSWGLSGDLAQNALSDGATQVASDAAAQAATQTATDAATQTASSTATQTAAEAAKAPTAWVRVAKASVALGSGLATGAVDAVKALGEKDPEKRKQMLKDAWKSASGAVVGAFAGMFAAEAVGELMHGDSSSSSPEPTSEPEGPAPVEEPKLIVPEMPEEAKTIPPINNEHNVEVPVSEPKGPAPVEEPKLIIPEMPEEALTINQDNLTDISPIAESNIPSHGQMYNFAEELEARLQENSEASQQAILHETLLDQVKNGAMTEEQAARASSIFSETGKNLGTTDYEEIARAVQKGALEADQEQSLEINAEIAAEQHAWEVQNEGDRIINRSNLYNDVAERYEQSGDIGNSMNQAVNEAVENGTLNQQEAQAAVAEFTASVEGHNGNVDKALDSLQEQYNQSAEEARDFRANHSSLEEENARATRPISDRLAELSGRGSDASHAASGGDKPVVNQNASQTPKIDMSRFNNGGRGMA